MALHRNNLPQLSDSLFLTDGGLETTLIFHEGVELPYFAAFDLLQSKEGTAALDKYYRTYAAIAKQNDTGFVLESPTWRANPDWGTKLGYSAGALATANRKSIEMLEEIRAEYEQQKTPMVISGCIGPRDDGYNPAALMTHKEAVHYHTQQIGAFADTAADMVAATTMTYAEEASGIAQAARQAGMPVAISFTTETDGKLPTGQGLAEAITQVDEETDNYPAYYMINCSHPTHFADALSEDASWLERIRGLRANASALSHAELDEAEELDAGNPRELGTQYKALNNKLQNLNVLGGCCGTDHRHIEAICKKWIG